MFDTKSKLLLVLAALLFLMSFLYLSKSSENASLKAASAQHEQVYAALNDTITSRVEKGIASYTKGAPQITVQDLMSSDLYDKMRAEQKAFYETLKKDQKNLIAAAQVRLSKTDTVFLKSEVRTVAESDTTVTFRRGQQVSLQDTTKMLKWHANITLDNPLAYHFNYTYKPTITTTFSRDKEKGTKVEFKINDPGLVANDIQSIVIPPDVKQRTAVGQWLYKNRGPLRFTGGAIIFGAGVYSGVRLK